MIIGTISGITTLLTFLWLSTPLSNQFVGDAVRRIKTDEKIVAITFDDGPVQGFTEKILDVLNENNVKATFFMIGQRAEQNPELVKKVYGLGHQLGNHTWSHPLMIGHSSRFFRDQIEKTDAALKNAGYKDEIYFRAPYGMKFYGLPKVLEEKHRKNILFDVISWDFNSPKTKKIVKNVLSAVRPGSIILMHDGCGTSERTVAATQIIIKKLKEHEYRFVTISELLSNDKRVC
jgi:peptidoglycan-N-acetylglucosamine deacetylase